MSTNDKRNLEDQEIDLAVISAKIKDFLQSINTGIFKAIQFVIKNIIIFVILFAIGIALGLYLDKNNKVYNHEIIVQPNFGSVDYLYSKIDLIESKIRENDTVYLKSIGIKDAGAIAKIEIKPIVDIYRFINSNTQQNFDLLKLMAEDGDMKQIVEDKITSKNYTYHMISFKTKKRTNHKETVEPILNYLNNSPFYAEVQKVFIDNIHAKMKGNDLIISQIDGFLNSFSNAIGGNVKNDKLVYYNENTQLNDVIQSKNKLITEQGTLRLNLVDVNKIIKENSSILNIQDMQSVNGKLKIILPLFFISLYILLLFFLKFYRKQSAKNK